MQWHNSFEEQPAPAKSHVKTRLCSQFIAVPSSFDFLVTLPLNLEWQSIMTQTPHLLFVFLKI
jgi:hypothetical protein